MIAIPPYVKIPSFSMQRCWSDLTDDWCGVQYIKFVCLESYLIQYQSSHAAVKRTRLLFNKVNSIVYTLQYRLQTSLFSSFDLFILVHTRYSK